MYFLHELAMQVEVKLSECRLEANLHSTTGNGLDYSFSHSISSGRTSEDDGISFFSSYDSLFLSPCS